MEPPGDGVQPDVDRGRAAWERRPFARTFDLISDAYGWTDDQILDLTMPRMRQIRDVIWERKREEKRDDLQVREAELRILAGFIAASAGHEKGIRQAEGIRLLPDDDAPGTAAEPNMIPYGAAKKWFG